MYVRINECPHLANALKFIVYLFIFVYFFCLSNSNLNSTASPATQLHCMPLGWLKFVKLCLPALHVPFNQTKYPCQVELFELFLFCLPHTPTQYTAVMILSSHHCTTLIFLQMVISRERGGLDPSESWFQLISFISAGLY